MDILKEPSQTIQHAVKTVMCLSISFMGLHPLTAATNQDTWASAYRHFQVGDASACYQELQNLNYLVGEISYDKLLGLCAQGAGNNDQALLAYNRILAQQENNAEIRLERARVFYNLNMYAEAKSEFTWLQDRNPPKAAAETIEQYLLAIKRKTSKIKKYTRLRISTSLGYDNNVNSATELDDFLGFTLNDTSKATASSYYGVGVAAEHNIKLSVNSGLKLSSSLSNKSYQDAEFANQDLVLVGLGYKNYLDQGVLDVDLLAYRQKVDSAFNSRGALFKAAFQKKLNDKISIKPYVRASALRYADNLSIKDVNQYSAGTTLNFVPGESRADMYSLDINVGHDYPIFTDSNYEANFALVNIAHRHKFTSTLSSYSQLQYKKYAYERPFFALSIPDNRSDNSFSVTTGLSWNMSNKFSLVPRLSYRNASSNVALFTYDRWYAEITANYQWIW